MGKIDNTEIKNILSQLNCWCMNFKGNINTAYFNSLTVTEQVSQLFWIVKTNTDLTNETITQFNELYDFVNEYFENLDLQHEVDKIITEMVNDGTIANIINDKLFTDLYNAINTNTENITEIKNNYLKSGSPESVSMGMLTQDVKEALTGGSTAVVGVDAVGTENIQDNSVTFDKICKLFTSIEFMFVNAVIDIDTNSKTITIKNSNEESQYANIAYNGRIYGVKKQTITYDNSDDYCLFYINTEDNTPTLIASRNVQNCDCILIGVISSTNVVVFSPSINYTLNSSIRVIDGSKIYANYLTPTIGTTNASLNFNISKNILNVRLTGSFIYGNRNISSDITLKLSENDFYYILYDLNDNTFKTGTLTKDTILLGAVNIVDLSTSNFSVATIPQLYTVINGSFVNTHFTWYYDNNPPFIDQYNAKLIMPPSLFNFVSDNALVGIDKNAIEIDRVKTTILTLDLNSKKILINQVNNSPIDKNRYIRLGSINYQRNLYNVNLPILRYGNSLYIFGDSIQTNVGVKNAYNETIYGSIGFQIAQSLGISPANFAISGMGYVREVDGKKIYDKLVESGNFTSSNITPIACILIAGVNDFRNNMPLGDEETEDTFTYEVNRCFSYISQNYYQCPFLVCTPLKNNGWNTPNTQEKTLTDYANIIKEYARKYKLLFYDLFNDENYDFTNNDFYLPDGLHPSYFAHRRLAPKIKSLIIT